MASSRRRKAAQRNIEKAQSAARRKKTITKLPKSVRTDLGRQAAKSGQRGGKPGRALEDRTRQDLYRVAKKRWDRRTFADGEVGPDQGHPQGGLTRA